MKPKLLATFMVLLAACTLVWCGSEETLEQLKQRAETARPEDQPKLFMEIAERDFKLADESYNRGDPDKGKAAVEELTSYCERAAAAVGQSGKHLKKTELKVRELARHLDAMSKGLAFDDREPVKASVDRLEKLRSDLLARMFEPKKP